MGQNNLGTDRNEREQLKNVIWLCVAAIILNCTLSFITTIFNLPVYLDSIGTILTAALSGGLPAIIVAFFSNLLCSINKSLNLYYAIPGVIIAGMAVFFSKRNMFKNWKGILLSVLCFAVIGGGIGTIIGWYTFGQQINGATAHYAFMINEGGVTPFLSQIIAELCFDTIDKSITVGIVSFILRKYPKKLYGRYPLSYLYEKSTIHRNEEQQGKYKHSVKNRLSFIVVTTVTIVGIFSLVMGILYYGKLLKENAMYNAQNISSQIALCVDGDLVEKQFKEGEHSEGYAQTEEKMKEIYDGCTDIRYLYVYVIKESGCYALYDLDVEGEKGRNCGEYVDKDPDIMNRLDEFLAGGEVSPGVGNSLYGTLISAYTPVRDSDGKTVAYACADINLASYLQQLLIYIIQFTTLVFSVIIFTLLLMTWYVNHYITKPIKMIVDQTRALDSISPENWLESKEWSERTQVKTDDELEDLYDTVTKAEENASINVRKRIETEKELLRTREFEQMNKEMEAMIKKADDANRAKTDFLSRMSHDMRTPMNAIIGLSALTLDDAEHPEVVRENMAKIRSSSDFLLGLVNDILDLAKIEDGSVVLKPEPYSYQEFLINMSTMFQSQCDAKDIKLSLQKLDKNPIILIDKMRFNQIFFNIMSNAVKYTPVGGKIEYRLEEFIIKDGNVKVEFVIEDTGIGMSEEYQKHLFEPFVQESSEVTPELQGSGLGLSITKQLIDLMGGTIRIVSKQGVGTTVYVHMEMECLAEDAKGIKSEEIVPADEEILNGHHILLAEDHPLNAQIARKLLEKKKMFVSHAENGKKAVEMFESSPESSIDAILMDIRMPEMSGLEATRAIRSLDRSDAQSVVIIAMSANAYPEDVQKSLDAGMNAHLAKPVDPQALYQTLAGFFSV